PHDPLGVFGARSARRNRVGAGVLGRAPRRRDGGLQPRDDAAALCEARRSAQGHRRGGLRPARAARMGRARGGGGRRGGAVSSQLPEDARRAEARPAVAGEEGQLIGQASSSSTERSSGRRAGRTSRHVHWSGSLSSRNRTSFVPWRKRLFSSLSKRTSTTSFGFTACSSSSPVPQR